MRAGWKIDPMLQFLCTTKLVMMQKMPALADDRPELVNNDP